MKPADYLKWKDISPTASETELMKISSFHPLILIISLLKSFKAEIRCYCYERCRA